MATGFRGAIGKFAKGVADVAVPAALEQHRAQILAKRESVLQGYQMEQQHDQQAAVSRENQANREFQGQQAASERTFQAGENDLNRAIEKARLDLQKEGQALDSQRVNSIIELTNLQIKDLDLDMTKKEQVNQLQQAVLDAGTPEAMDTALTKLQGFLGKELYSPMTVYGEEDPVSGTQPKASGVINQVTGGFTPMGMPTPSADLSTPESVRSAMREGTITRDKARELLQAFQQQ